MESHTTAVATLARKHLTQNIEKLRPGDLVACRDQFDPHGPTVLRPIEEVFIRTAYHLQVVTIRSSSGIEHTLHTTAEHPVYVLGQGWVDAGEIKPGDLLQEPDGSISTIIESRREEHPEGVAVYNFSVYEAHTYFVREEGSTAEPVWVHNAGGYGTEVDRGGPALAHRLKGSDRHHPVFSYLLRAFQKAGFPIKSAGRMPRQKLVPLGIDAHETQVHSLWDDLFPSIGRGKGASDRIARMIREGKAHPSEILDDLDSFYQTALREYPDQLQQVVSSMKQTRRKIGL